MIVIYVTPVSNDDISRHFFHFFWNFNFLVVRGVKRQKNWPIWQKIMSVALHISGTISHMTVIYSTHVKNDNISRIFFHFFKILIFWVLWRQKCKRWSKMTKKLSLSCLVSQETYIIWFKFMVYVCKMIISPGGFFIFSKFWFFGLLGDKRAKNCPKWQKIPSVALHISGTIHMIVIFGTYV